MTDLVQEQAISKANGRSRWAVWVGSFTATGIQRKRNEDAYAVPLPGANETGLGTLIAVADGVGGQPDGAAASRDAVQYLQALYYAGPGPADPASRLRECVEIVNAINRMKRSSPDPLDGYLTTLVAAVIFQNQVWVANIGDSRAYLIPGREGERRQLTEDHSDDSQFQDNHQQTPDAPSRSGAIHHAIGMADHCPVDLYHYEWSPKDCLVLCTDGLYHLPAGEMAEIARSLRPQEAAHRLVDRAVQVDGSDNCTAVVAVLEELQIATPRRLTGARPRRVRSRSRRASDWLVVFLAALLGLLAGWLSAALIYLYLTGQLPVFAL